MLPERYTLAPGRTLDDLIAIVAAGRILFAPRLRPGGRTRWERADRWDPARHAPGAFRTDDPLKSLFFPPREFLGPLGGPAPADDPRERVAVGVKRCDLDSLAVHDLVFRDDAPADPTYVDLRRRTILIGADCTECLDVCFCTATGLAPHPEGGCDLNLASTAGGPVVEVFTERGRAVAAEAAALLAPASEGVREALDTARAAMTARVQAQTERHGLPRGADLAGAVAAAMDAGLWQRFAEDCVECGACNFACCTCHCFLLADGADSAGRPARAKLWDSCLFPAFARVAGGGNPRDRRAERLRNRFDKKFVFFPEILGRMACDGCGRCTEACAGRIDIRAVLKGVLDERERQPVPAGAG